MAASLRIEPTERPLVRLPHFVPQRNMHHAPGGAGHAGGGGRAHHAGLTANKPLLEKVYGTAAEIGRLREEVTRSLAATEPGAAPPAP